MEETTEPVPDADSLAAEFPGWRAWRGVTGVWYAQTRMVSPPVTLHATSAGELRKKLAAKAAGQ